MNAEWWTSINFECTINSGLENCVALNYILCNNLAPCKVKSLCCRPLLFSAVTHFTVSHMRLSSVFSSTFPEQYHNTAALFLRIAVRHVRLLAVWLSRDASWVMWKPQGMFAVFLFDGRFYCFDSLGLIAQLTVWFLCTGLSLKSDTRQFIFDSR